MFSRNITLPCRMTLNQNDMVNPRTDLITLASSTQGSKRRIASSYAQVTSVTDPLMWTTTEGIRRLTGLKLLWMAMSIPSSHTLKSIWSERLYLTVQSETADRIFQLCYLRASEECKRVYTPAGNPAHALLVFPRNPC